MNKIRPIAYYLPQFHPIPENDEWWGKGFTEWTNVTKAKPLFKGHKQPHLPADLGYYDLRVPEVREQQAQLAREAGIEGFCYWHYWFGNGKQLLERPFKEVLKDGKPDFPFCLAWANESWSGIWHGAKDKVLIKQEYPGIKDYEDHFYELLPAFSDKRYITVDDKPLFVIYNPTDLPEMREFCEIFQNLAVKNSLKGLHLIANNIKNVKIDWDPETFGFDAYTISAHNRIIHDGNSLDRELIKKAERRSILHRLYNKISRQVFHHPVDINEPLPQYIYKYEEALEYFLLENDLNIDSYPTVITGWDNSPRSGRNGLILTGYTPEKFRLHLKRVFPMAGKNRNKIVFIKSWNEWAEGNYLEPESEFGTQFLNVLRDELLKYRGNNNQN
jgi:hypothetical protein